MPIEFRCSQCGKLLQTADSTAGKQAKCPACGAVATIPETSTAESAPPPQSGDAWDPLQQSAGGAESQPWEAVTNPYQPPASCSSATAQARVSGPAVALMVVAGIGGVLQAISILINVVTMLAEGPRGPDPLLFGGAVNLSSAVVGFGSAFVVIYGALQMKSLQSHGWAMTSAILAMVPCLSPCCLLGLPIGIWALVVILSPEVKSAFRG